MTRLKLIQSTYFKAYKEKQRLTLLTHFNKVKNIKTNPDIFDFYFSSSAVYSSMIEGNLIDFDSYLKYSYSGMNNTGKSYREIEDLKAAYSFAKSKKLTFKNFLSSHKIIVKTIIENSKYKGEIRDKDVYVFSDGKKIYTGASKGIVSSEMIKLFEDIKILLLRKLSIHQIFYYASMLHLILVQIHPFADGNGRVARLLEKWFLAEMLGANAWFIQSEKLYQKRITYYYKNVHIGNDYTTINYDYSLPFLLMLPMALRLKQ